MFYFIVICFYMKGYLTIKEAAEYLKVHPESIRRYVRDKKLRSYKGEKIIRFKQEDLDSLLTPSDVDSSRVVASKIIE